MAGTCPATISPMATAVALLAAAVLLAVSAWALSRAKRRLVGRSESPGGGFAMEHLEDMLARGLISRQEFTRLRDRALGRSGEAAGHSSPPLGNDDGKEGQDSNQAKDKDF